MESILEAIGNTPSVRLRRCAPANGAELWLKLEYRNPTGSMKDRMALAMVEGAERDGLISPGDTIVEHAGGSTGPALALVSARAAPGERHAQCVEHQRGAHVGGKLPAHHAPAEDVDHEAQEDDALPAAQLGEVRDPELIRPGRSETPFDEIRQPPQKLGLGCLPALATALGAAHPGLAHDAGDVVTADLDSGAAQRFPGLARPVSRPRLDRGPLWSSIARRHAEAASDI